MRHLVALLPLLVACSPDPSPPAANDASTTDTNAVDVTSSDAAVGSCPEGQRWCSATSRNDICFQPGAAGSVLNCVTDSRLPQCDLPPPCGVCAAGARLWRREDLVAHSATIGDGGACPGYGDAGVPASAIRQ